MRIPHKKEGQDFVEYALLIVLAAIVIILVLVWMGRRVTAVHGQVTDVTPGIGETGGTGVELEPDNNGIGLAGETVYYNHVITNTTALTQTFEIVAESGNGWFTLPSTTFPDTLVVGPGESLPLDVNMTIPGSVVSGTMDTMVVTATAMSNPTIFDTAFNYTTVLTEQVAGVDVFPNYSGTAAAGESVTFTHTVRNLGNSFDTFTMTAVSDQGWVTSVSQPNLNLFAGQQSNVIVTVNVPGTAVSGTLDTTTVMAVSGFDPAVSDSAFDLTTVVSDPPTGGVSVTPNNSGSGAPGDTLQYAHTVANLTSATETYNLTVSSSELWPVFVAPASIQILGNDSRVVTVTVMIPGTAVNGTVDVTTLTATAQSDPGITDSATDTTSVLGDGQTLLFMPAVFKPETSTPTPTPTPTPTATNTPCILNVPPSGNPSGIDLVITGLTLVPANPAPGQTTQIRVTIKNEGQTSVSVGNNFYLDFYDTPNPEPPQAFQIGNVAWGVQGADLGAGQSKTLTANYVFGAGTHRLWAQVDTDRTVAEVNENNNLYGCKALTVGAAQAVPNETPPPQPTADQPRQTPTPGSIQEAPAAEQPKLSLTPVP